MGVFVVLGVKVKGRVSTCECRYVAWCICTFSIPLLYVVFVMRVREAMVVGACSLSVRTLYSSLRSAFPSRDQITGRSMSAETRGAWGLRSRPGSEYITSMGKEN